jgi:predicted dehydrogenase
MIRLALLSCAHVHTKGYCKAIAERDDASLAVVWDDVPERGRKYASEFGAEFCDDLEASVARDDVDGVIICAENTRHLPLLEAAVPAGKPVFCEKPLTTTVAGARKALALIRRHDTAVFLGYFQPFSPELQAAARLLDDGALGTVTHARYRNAHHAAYGRWFDSPDNAWFTDPELAGGGAFMDMGTHAVHAMRSLLGPAEQVWATIRNVSGEYPDVDDHGIAMVRFAGGVLGTIEAGWVQTGGPRGLEITGSRATLYNDPQRGHVVAEPGQDPVAMEPAPAKPTRVDRLVAVIRGELPASELAEDLAAAADAVAIVEACYESSRTGSWADVPSVG